MGYKYMKRGIRIGFSFTLGMMLLLSGCSGEMEEMRFVVFIRVPLYGKNY